MDIHILPADWKTHAETLRAIRGTVFIEEQQVPKNLEWDGEDEHAHHFLAINAAGQRMGCARLLPSGQIGRMAVLAEYRGSGIGNLLLNSAVETAKQLGMNKVFLHAQAHAESFYRKAGFRPVGGEYMEAGIAHQSMELELPIPFEAIDTASKPNIREQSPPADQQANELLKYSGETDCRDGLVDALRWPMRAVRIYSPSLDHALFDQPSVVDALSSFVRRGPPAHLQVLIHSFSAIVSRGHRLLELARRLDSKIELHVVATDQTADKHSCMIGDEQSFWLLPDHNEYQAFANRFDPVQATRLAERFDYLWTRSQVSPELRTFRL